jgi:hypothetical protein
VAGKYNCGAVNSAFRLLTGPGRRVNGRITAGLEICVIDDEFRLANNPGFDEGFNPGGQGNAVDDQVSPGEAYLFQKYRGGGFDELARLLHGQGGLFVNPKLAFI